MNALEEFVASIQERAEVARDALASRPRLARHIDTNFHIPRPFLGGKDIGLVVLGQDPTIKNEARRAHIRTVLHLDREGPLRRYVGQIAQGLGLSLQNVYATNVCKHFFRRRPTEIEAGDGQDVLSESAEMLVPIVRRELEQFPEAIVVSLGQPVLSVLVSKGSRRVRSYWGYPDPLGTISAIARENSVVGRKVYPLPHQPSAGRAFYKAKMARFLESVKHQATL